MSSQPDLISVTALSLRTPSLPSDLWQRPSKSQPLLVSLSIQTDVREEANTDSLLGDSFNYGTVTKAIEKAVSELPPAEDADGIPLEVLAEQLAQVVIFKAKAPNVRLELSRPRALLSAESVGVEIYRSASDYLPAASPTGLRQLDPASTSPAGDKLSVRALRRLIIIGINPCERLDEQEVIADFEFFAGDMSTRLANGARAGWASWRPIVKQLESHLSSSGPLTIEHLTTALSQIILTPPSSPSSTVPSWDVSRTTVRVAKPSALMFAKYPAVQVTRSRSDFFNPDGSIRSAISRRMTTSAAPSSVATTSTSESGASTAATEPETSRGGAGALHSVVLGVGTNMGERVGNISKALKEVEKLGSERGDKTRVVDTSFLYESEAMYVEDQAKFLNAAVKIETSLEPLPLLNLLKTVEASLGRQKTIRNGPRPIDLDILFFDDIVYDSREEVGVQDERWLKIPHASIAEREFVLRPLVDLIPDFRHPSLNSTPRTLLDSLLSSSPSTLKRVLPLSSSLTHTLPTRRTLVMSILNTTPDSFSDGGDHTDLDTSLSVALSHLKLGAHILDIGGMSTRPGAADVSPEEEASRVVPLIKALRAEGVTAPISIDSFRPSVARAAIEAGADIVNDVLGGAEEGMLETMAELDVPVVLMHSRGTPSTMSKLTDYDGDVVSGVRRELAQRVQAALDAGVKRWNIVLDPGVGFAKTGDDNLVLLRHLPASMGHGVEGEGSWLSEFPLLVGLSRKKFIGTLTGREVAKERVLGTAAGVTASIAGGADIVRVHDVEAMVDVVKVADGIYRS